MIRIVRGGAAPGHLPDLHPPLRHQVQVRWLTALQEHSLPGSDQARGGHGCGGREDFGGQAVEQLCVAQEALVVLPRHDWFAFRAVRAALPRWL